MMPPPPPPGKPRARVWRPYGTNPPPLRRGGAGATPLGLPVVVSAHRVRPLRHGAHAERSARHSGQRNLRLRDLLARARHEGCGGWAAKAELLTGTEGVSSRPVRRIVLRG